MTLYQMSQPTRWKPPNDSQILEFFANFFRFEIISPFMVSASSKVSFLFRPIKSNASGRNAILHPDPAASQISFEYIE